MDPNPDTDKNILLLLVRGFMGSLTRDTYIFIYKYAYIAHVLLSCPTVAFKRGASMVEQYVQDRVHSMTLNIIFRLVLGGDGVRTEVLMHQARVDLLWVPMRDGWICLRGYKSGNTFLS